MRLSAVVSVVRGLGPVVIGISLGFTLSLLSVSWTEEACYLGGRGGQEGAVGREGLPKGARKPSSILTGNDAESEEDFEPRIVPYKQVQQSPAKKVFRAKYISTELGMRERLFVGVLTSKNTISTLGVAVNRTISHHLDTVVSSPACATTITSMSMTGFTWSRMTPTRRPTGSGPCSSVERWKGSTATVGSGTSRTLLLRLQPFLENCRNDILSARPDEWLGRCIIDYTSANCVSEYEVG
uniref:Hexosyltransferase n=1 Tax=Sphaeramia orbicularis TaxID=375764 RepID=A0A673AWD2_9TELE